MADEVSVPVSLLEQVRDTVTTAQYHSQTLDLAESYRKQGNPKWSKMTNNLTGSAEVLQSFIDIAKTEEEETEGESNETDG